MNTVKILLSIILVAIIGSLTWAFFLPADVHIEEKTTIDAPMENVFNQVNNFHNWKNWAPWQDTVYHTKFEGPQQGVGARMLWTDEKEGRSVQTITESKYGEEIVTELVFGKDENPAKAIFKFKETSNGVEVSWIMDVNNLSYPFGRFVGFMINKGASHNFKKGVEKMKEYVEANINTPYYDGYTINEDERATKYYIAYSDSGKMEELQSKIANAYSVIMKTMSENKITPKAYPIVEWNNFDPQGISSFTALMETGKDYKINGDAHSYTIPEGKFVWVKYIGPYEQSDIAWNNLDKYIKDNKLEMRGDPFEEYITDPGTEADSTKWITNIYFPVK
jgi:effector-binding domain-containing protein